MARADYLRRPGDWRQTVAGASGANAVVGVWLVLSPFLLGYGDEDPVWNPIVAGAAVAAIAGVRVGLARRAHWLSWINALIGAWLFLSGFWLAESDQAQLNAWIAGVVVLLLAMWSATAEEENTVGPRP
jgi:hypothetical protein